MVSLEGRTYPTYDAAIEAAKRHNSQWKYPNKLTKIYNSRGALKIIMERGGMVPRWITPKKIHTMKLVVAPTTRRIEGKTWYFVHQVPNIGRAKNTAKRLRRTKEQEMVKGIKREDVPIRIVHTDKHGYMLYTDSSKKASVAKRIVRNM